MAEVFAIVASSLTIVELFGKTVSGIQKIHHFSSSIHNAPRKLTEAVAELHVLGLVLKRLQENPSFQSDGVATQELLQHCFQVVKELEDVFSRLQQRFIQTKGHKRHWAAIQSYMNKSSIDEIYQRLHRAINLLNLLISDHILVVQQTLASSEHHDGGKSSRKSNIEGLVIDENSSTRNRVSLKITPGNNFYFSCFVGIFSYNSGTQEYNRDSNANASKRESRRTINLTVLPSTWLCQWGFSMLYMKKALYQEHRWTAIRVVPDASPIFDACRSGDIQEVSNLLNSSTATIHDTSQWGWTLLHIAAMHAQADMCRWLLQRGCNSNSVDARNGWTPLLAISAVSGQTTRDSLFRKRKEFGILQPPNSPHPSSRIKDVVRLLIEEGGYDPMDVSTTGWSSLNEYSGPVEPFKYLIEQQDRFVVSFKSFSIEQHNDLAWSLADQFWRNSAELLLVALHHGLAPNVKDNFQPVWNRFRACTLLHVEAKRLDRYAYEGWSLEHSLQVMANYIEKGADPNFQDSFGATPLDDILSYKGKDENVDAKARVLLEWLSLLGRLDIDVDEYLAREESIHDVGLVVHVKHYRPDVPRRFKVERESKNITISVADEVVYHSSESFPGSWVEGWGGFEKDSMGRCICRNTNAGVAFKVSATGN